jgi:hypothetical protein
MSRRAAVQRDVATTEVSRCVGNSVRPFDADQPHTRTRTSHGGFRTCQHRLDGAAPLVEAYSNHPDQLERLRTSSSYPNEPPPTSHATRDNGQTSASTATRSSVSSPDGKQE